MLKNFAQPSFSYYDKNSHVALVFYANTAAIYITPNSV